MIGTGIDLGSLATRRSAQTDGDNPADADAAMLAVLSGRTGGAWDFNRGSTLWTDAAATSPAAVSDPVRRADDIAGSANILSGADAARPVRQASGVLWSLTSRLYHDFGAPSGTAWFTSMRCSFPETSAFRVLFESSELYGSDGVAFSVFRFQDPAADISVAVWDGGSYSASYTVPSGDCVLSIQVDNSLTHPTQLFLNGSEVSRNSFTDARTGNNNLGSGLWVLGNRFSQSVSAIPTIQRAFTVQGTVTSGERATVEAWVGA